MHGTILEYSEEDGVGWIQGPDGGTYMFKGRNLLGDRGVRIGDVVEFERRQETKRVGARIRRLVSSGPEPGWEYPDTPLLSRSGNFPHGFRVERELGEVGAAARGFANARRELMDAAIRKGGNAVVITREWSEDHEEKVGGGIGSMFTMTGRITPWSIARSIGAGGVYRYRTAHLEGRAVIVARKHRGPRSS
jgi:hypothetical protein